MLRTILVAVDESPQREPVLDQAAELAIATGATVHVVFVMDVSLGVGLAPGESSVGAAHVLARQAERVLTASCARLSESGVPCRTHAVGGLVPEEIAELAREVEAGLIVVGHRFLSWSDRLFETSVCRGLLDRAPCNVLIVMEGAA